MTCITSVREHRDAPQLQKRSKKSAAIFWQPAGNKEGAIGCNALLPDDTPCNVNCKLFLELCYATHRYETPSDDYIPSC
jgi:hypothetical protein